MAGGVAYDERLRVPWRWWALALLAVAAIGVAVGAAVGPWTAPVTGGIAGVVGAALWAYGSAPVTVGPGGLRAGRALLPAYAVGRVEVLDAAAAAHVRGPGFEPAAYHLIRGYLPRAIRVEVTDPDDPTPYWYVATRHPERLAAAVRALAAAAPPPP